MTADDESGRAVNRVVLVTGPSGAGRSTAIHMLEDLGYEAIDNLPLSLLPRLLSGPPLTRPLALGIDARNRDFSVAGVIEVAEILRSEAALEGALVYLDCRADVLLRRFSETRRRHPLDAATGPEAAIAQELELLAGLRRQADILIDTSELTPHDLRAEIGRWFAEEDIPRMTVSVHSFSYKRGLPRSLDLAIDCRFLRNPYWKPDLRGLNGTDAAVADYVRTDARFPDFEERLNALLEALLPGYLAEGKSHFTIGFGCTGGQHRSVAVAETVAKALAASGWQVSIRHGEIERRAGDTRAGTG